MRRILPLAALLLAGCGLRENLEPPPGQSLPIAPAASRRPPDAERLLAQPEIARPARVDELLLRSEERNEDRFDLPPAEVPAGEVLPDPVEDEGPQ